VNASVVPPSSPLITSESLYSSIVNLELYIFGLRHHLRQPTIMRHRHLKASDGLGTAHSLFGHSAFPSVPPACTLSRVCSTLDTETPSSYLYSTAHSTLSGTSFMSQHGQLQQLTGATASG
jgi:hypothetical protein